MYSLSAKSLCRGNIDAMLFVLRLWRGRDVTVLECCVVCFFNFLFSWLRSPTEYQPSSTTQPHSKKHILPCLRLFTLPSFRLILCLPCPLLWNRQKVWFHFRGKYVWYVYPGDFLANVSTERQLPNSLITKWKSPIPPI